MQPLAQPPDTKDANLTRWLFLLWKRINATAGMAWAIIDKTGSNLTDIETRNHADLQNINTATYTHLSATNHTDLTDGGDSTLHYHATDRDSANFTGTSWTDLTDAGATTLHKHDHGGMDGLADDDHAQYALVSNFEADRATIASRWDDLTDGGDSTLHYHNADRKTQNVISSAFAVNADESYTVVSYLKVTGDLTVAGNIRIL